MNKTIVKATLLLSVMLTGLTASAQTQQGYVKTKGRMVNGQLVPGQGLKGATVSVQGRTAVLVNADDGAFSFPVTNAQFSLDSVKKKGYQLVDMDACPRSYKYSGNPIYIVMETPDQQLQDKLTAERKIRRNLQKQLQEKEDEIEDLKAQQKISDEEYRRALQKLYADQESNEQLISDMAKRYSELDYDQLDEFYRQVSYCIENGELVKADSLLNTRGDLNKQVEEQLKKGQAIQEQEAQLNQAKAVHAADQEELARRCYSYYETFAAQHLNDTAAYYLELRSNLDTTNVDWLIEAAEFEREYKADYDKALKLFQKALRQSLSQHDATRLDVSDSYNGIGFVYTELGEFDKALECFNNALEAWKQSLLPANSKVAEYYNNIGAICLYTNKLDDAMDNFNIALEIWKETLGPEHINVGLGYNNVGYVYYWQDNFEKALEYFNKSLELKKPLGPEHPDLAVSYNNIGLVYSDLEEYDKALEYYQKATEIWEKSYGPKHPQTATGYNNIGTVYGHLRDFDKAVEYHQNALEISKITLGLEHPEVAEVYFNLGYLFSKQGEYEKALDYLNKALEIRIKTLEPDHPDIRSSYSRIGAVYFEMGEFDKALEYLNKALKIAENMLGPDHNITLYLKEKIAETQARIKEQENEQSKKEE